MSFFSIILRRIFSFLGSCANFFRILKLKALYPGISVDFSSCIESNCKIVCVKGGTLNISRSHISFGTQIIADNGSRVFIENAFIGRNCVITSKAGIHISEGTMIAEMVVIRDQDHNLNVSEKMGTRHGFTSAPIIIEKNAWIAAKATILKGVTIGHGAVLAASSVVNRSVPAGELWGGIPGKVIRTIK